MPKKLELLRMNDVADKAGFSLAHAYRLSMDKKSFPRPVEIFGTIGLFDPLDVKRWIKRRKQKCRAN